MSYPRQFQRITGNEPRSPEWTLRGLLATRRRAEPRRSCVRNVKQHASGTQTDHREVLPEFLILPVIAPNRGINARVMR